MCIAVCVMRVVANSKTPQTDFHFGGTVSCTSMARFRLISCSSSLICSTACFRPLETPSTASTFTERSERGAELVSSATRQRSLSSLFAFLCSEPCHMLYPKQRGAMTPVYAITAHR